MSAHVASDGRAAHSNDGDQAAAPSTKFNFYACGPTTYDMSHLGHARVYVVVDCMRRALRYLGHDVHFAMNVTDIDDKIIDKGGADGWRDVAQRYEREFWRDMDALHVAPPDTLLRATECVSEMIEYIGGILRNGFAYARNGSVYFDVRAYGEHGYLAPDFAPTLNSEEADADATNADKRGARDFALWKAAKPGEPHFASPWGDGRPGWHIECSAMVRKAFGDAATVHLHAGGVDLRFPHHTNEVLQGVAFYDGRNPFEAFVHVGHLHIDGCKMSKSLKNFRTIRSVLDGGVPADVLRVAMLAGAAWSHPMDFDEHMFVQARAALRTLDSYLARFPQSALDDAYATAAAATVQPLSARDARIVAALDKYRFAFHELLNRAVEATRCRQARASNGSGGGGGGGATEGADGGANNEVDALPFVVHAMCILGVPLPQRVTDADALRLIEFRQCARAALLRNEVPPCAGAGIVTGSSNVEAPPPSSAARREWFAYLDRVRDVHLRDMGVTVEDDASSGTSTFWCTRR